MWTKEGHHPLVQQKSKLLVVGMSNVRGHFFWQWNLPNTFSRLYDLFPSIDYLSVTTSKSSSIKTLWLLNLCLFLQCPLVEPVTIWRCTQDSWLGWNNHPQSEAIHVYWPHFANIPHGACGILSSSGSNPSPCKVALSLNHWTITREVLWLY